MTSFQKKKKEKKKRKDKKELLYRLNVLPNSLVIN